MDYSKKFLEIYNKRNFLDITPTQEKLNGVDDSTLDSDKKGLKCFPRSNREKGEGNHW